MSSQKGNVSRNRAQKHKNTHAFKNDLHDSTPKTKFLNSLEITDVCAKCKGVLEWRIQFKKYKLLKNPATCTKCHRKNVTSSYRIMCKECADKLKACPKCGLNDEEQKLEALAAKGGKMPKPKKEPEESEVHSILKTLEPEESEVHSFVEGDRSSPFTDECIDYDCVEIKPGDEDF